MWDIEISFDFMNSNCRVKCMSTAMQNYKNDFMLALSRQIHVYEVQIFQHFQGILKTLSLCMKVRYSESTWNNNFSHVL
jgi:hypothetical protein